MRRWSISTTATPRSPTPIPPPPGLQVALAPNLARTTHDINVKVTAETGTPKATKTYTVTVTKEASDVQLPGAPTGPHGNPRRRPDADRPLVDRSGR